MCTYTYELTQGDVDAEQWGSTLSGTAEVRYMMNIIRKYISSIATDAPNSSSYTYPLLPVSLRK